MGGCKQVGDKVQNTFTKVLSSLKVVSGSFPSLENGSIVSRQEQRQADR